MLPMLTSYTPSGAIGARAIAITIMAGLPLSAALGYTLAWAQSLAHGAIASTICALIAAVLVGVVFAVWSEQTRSRSVRANTAAAVFLLACMFTVRWWRAESLPGEALFSLVMQAPIQTWAGDLLGAVLEALPIAAISLVICNNQAKMPFSEATNTWAQKDIEGELWLGSGSTAAVKEQLQTQGLPYLLSLSNAAHTSSPAASQWSTITVTGYRVAADDDACWLSVKVRQHERDAEGKIKSQAEDVLTYWHVTTSEYALIATKFNETGSPKSSGCAEEGSETHPKTAPPTPTILQPAVTALEAEQYAVCHALAQAHCQHPEASVKADAWRLCALAKARMEEWAAAFNAYHQLFTLEPSSLNALQLATTSVMCGELARGEAWFKKAVELNEQNAAMPPAQQRTAYLSALERAGEFEAAVPHLEWLARGYMAMGITDDHFVWTRGFPFLSEFLTRSRQLLSQVMPEHDVRDWYARMVDALDEEGQRRVQKHLADQTTA